MLFGISVLGLFVGFGFVFLPIFAASRWCSPGGPRPHAAPGHLVTARRRHRLARRWRQVTYWSIPVVLGLVTVFLVSAFLQTGW